MEKPKQSNYSEIEQRMRTAEGIVNYLLNDSDRSFVILVRTKVYRYLELKEASQRHWAPHEKAQKK